MAGIPHDHYKPGSKGEKWLHSRLPIVGLLYDTLMIPTPKNLNWMWIWGIVLTFCLALQIITGIVLAMVIIQGLSLFFTFYTLVNIDKKNREIKRLRKQVKMYENYAYGLEQELVALDNTKAELASKLSVTEYMLAEQAEMLAKPQTKKKGVKK